MMSTQGRILVVDDIRTNVMVLMKTLEKAGYEVVVASDGFQAVDLAGQVNPDLILLDIMMPDRDGLEVCVILKSQEETASIPIIFVTANSDSDRIVDAFSAGGCDYITKPIRVGEMLARVRVHLSLRQAERDLKVKNDELKKLADRLLESNTAIAKQARIEPLTGLLNRGAWDKAAQNEHARARRYNRVHSIIMIDIDHFKSLNDALGHPVGDECLARVAKTIAATCRSIEFVGRYGGEEFVVFVPEASLDAACTLAERIRQDIWDLGVRHPSSPAGRVTVSIGVASNECGSFESLLKEADAALYRAKNGGRNLVYAYRNRHSSSDQAPGDSGIAAPVGQDPSTVEVRASILIVDDNPTNRALCKGCLTGEGYRIREAVDGLSAIAEVEKEAPDVIVMDVMMPGMDGYECTRRLKRNIETQSIPIIIVSACTDGTDVVAGLEAGADEYITKPYRTAELALRVRSMVKLRREQGDLLRSYQLRAEQIHVLMLLLDFCRAIGSAVDLDEILDQIVMAVANVTCCRRVSIMLPDAERRHLMIAKSIGIDDETAAEFTVPIGEAIAGTVFAEHRRIVVNTREQSDVPSSRYDSLFFASVPLLSVPLGGEGETIGVLNATERIGGRPFEQRELEYIELITQMAGNALHGGGAREARDTARDSIMVALARLAEHRDEDAAGHVERVTRYSQVLAEELRSTEQFSSVINEQFLQCLTRSVPLHDIGKVAIPDCILRKPGRLTVEEMSIMQTHAKIGAETLRTVIDRTHGSRFLEMAQDIIQAHHEWYDGSGYPTGLQGDAIPLSARIVALADVYEALTTKRVYKEAVGHDKAVAIVLESSGTQFDPRIVDAFSRREKEFAKLVVDLADVESLGEGETKLVGALS